tara:strand:+ start:255 stop:725 length:471 start_codon:yes stop_codon:yes gene_type:complete
MIDTTFSTALGYMPSNEDNLRKVLLAGVGADHAMAKAGIPSGITGLRAQPQEQGGHNWGNTLKQGLNLFNAWQDSRNYSSGVPWGRGAAGYKDNYSSGLDAPFFDRGGMTYWDSDSDVTIPTNSFDMAANAEVAAGLGSDNSWWQGIKNIWSSGGN